ncbi:hypothetical protein H5410_056576 [Solanum commersonii]|uniref:DNA-directed RNA polymerase n=1 Tax=Solanum commersonii TaxID=4109 RepID=A0A9J5WLP9_SOLCO|nr:hypothetical protein H5410_056576 [Solanum commersonii]
MTHDPLGSLTFVGGVATEINNEARLKRRGRGGSIHFVVHPMDNSFLLGLSGSPRRLQPKDIKASHMGWIEVTTSISNYMGLNETDFHNYDRKSGAISKYQNVVFDLLDNAKRDGDIHHPGSLIELQKRMERLAYPYDSMKNIYQAAPQIMKLLIQDDEPTARSIIVHIFGLVFNSIDESPAVRLSTLVDQLDCVVRTQALMMYERDKTIECEFALDGIIPIQLNLPMVSPPKDWHVAKPAARSLIVFSKRTVKESKMNTLPPKWGPAIAQNMYLAATAFHYKKYPSYEEALQAGLDLESIKTPEDIIERASTAKDPYQYISKVVTLAAESTKVSPDQLPITQDASASAYQIISYFMLDFQLAKYTNLIPTKVHNSEHLRINDIYDFFLSELIDGAPVYYSTPMFTTAQDYMKSEAVNIWLYDRQSKKICQVTLRVPTPERDRRKTTSTIFANFIHQKDAIIAFNMIKNVKKRGIPIYIVHDNFITTMDFAHDMGESYIEILLNSPHPMEYINSFLAINLFDEAHTPGGLCQIDLDGCFDYAYPKDSKYGKFTIHYSMETTSGITTYALGQAITFRVGRVNQPVRDIVDAYVREKAEAYNDLF